MWYDRQRFAPSHMRTFIFIMTLFLGMLSLAGVVKGESKDIHIMTVDAAIGPAVAGFVEKTIYDANDVKAACVIIALDTPGGLVESMRTIVKAIFNSDIPVIVFVSPSGARAASAGVPITMAADVAAMAPGTNIGAAHPVGPGGQEISETMAQKAVNDMAAYIKSIAKKRGRNSDWAEKAVRESVSITETEAVKQNVVDLIARDMDDLITQLNGRKIVEKGTLKLDSATRKMILEDFRTKVLKTISDPNIAYILLLIGLAGLFFELSIPGAVFPGVVGAMALILAFFSMQTLPVNYAGLLLIGLAMIFFIVEMKVTSYGLLSLAGVLSLLLGTLMMFKGDNPAMQLEWQVVIPTILLVSGFFVVVAAMVFKAQVSQPKTGDAGLIGKKGVVRHPLRPEGKIFIHGELWQARAHIALEVGTKVRVTEVNGMVLTVEPLEPEA
jgi:membrane-bound serine protease (ClpP class)